MNSITRVWLDESINKCTLCGVCEAICPQVFVVPHKMRVKDANLFSFIKEIEEAVDSCPVDVIALEFDHSGKRDNERRAFPF